MAERRGQGTRASTRVIVALVAGCAAGILPVLLGWWSYAPSFGWDVAAIVFLVWTWLAVVGMDGPATATHALREEPGKQVARLIVLVAAVASLIGVGFLLVRAASTTSGADEAIAAGLGVLTVAVSWTMVHTIFTLEYASRYFTPPIGGIDFGDDDVPRYTDFAYLAFTVGMTFQVSDTTLRSHGMRSTTLPHALLSYLFGSFILATAVNLIASLAGLRG